MPSVGRSGSGKSTMASLITRFYDIDEGQILMDGHDLREYKLASLRDQVALVSQNVHLFNDTVANNIAYARTEEYSREEVEQAAKMAYALDFINKMDQGHRTRSSVKTAYCSPAVSVSVSPLPARCCGIAQS